MPTAPFQRRITNPLQRPLASDLNLQAFYSSVTQAYMAGIMFSTTPSTGFEFESGFVADSFRVTADPSTRGVIVRRGLGLLNSTESTDISSIPGLNSGPYKTVVCQPTSPVAVGVALPVASLGAGLLRIDVVCVKAPDAAVDQQNIGILNPTSETFSFQNRPLQFTENAASVTASLQVITGTPSAITPSVPTIPSGYREIARIYVPTGSAVFSNSVIQDMRPVLIPHGARSMALSFSSWLGKTNPSDVVGFEFGGNGVRAVVKPVYASGSKYFEVYVSAGTRLNIEQSFEMVAGGWCLPANQLTPTQPLNFGIMSSVLSKESVTRASAQPVFDAAGASFASIGQYVTKFTVLAGFLVANTPSSCSYINIDDATVDGSLPNLPESIVRLTLFQQAP